MRYLPLLALGLLSSGCLPNPDVLVMKEEPGGGAVRDTVYLTNGQLASQEISTLENGVRVNVWRYYEKNLLVREDVDTNFDGIIDTVRIFDPKDGRVIKVLRDSNFDGLYDSQTEFDSAGRPGASAGTIYPRAATPVPARAPDARRVATQPEEPPVNRRSSVPAIPGDDTDVTVDYDDTPVQTTAPAVAPTVAPAAAPRGRPATLQSVLSDDDGGVDTSALESHETAPARTPAASRSTAPVDGSLIQRITPPSRLTNLTPASNSGVVPDATFQHPSAGLEE